MERSSSQSQSDAGAPGLGADGAVAFPPLWTLSLESERFTFALSAETASEPLV